MHCPRCGQQQVSEEIKFCSRCGFPLGLVSEILAHGGFLPQLADLYRTKSLWNRKNGVIFSIFWFIFFTMLMPSIFGILEVDILAGLSAVVGVFGSLMLMIGSLVFLKSSKDFQVPQVATGAVQGNAQMPEARQQQALPAQESTPIFTYVPPGSWRDSLDLVEPGTVTDETTRILNKETK